MVGIEPTPRGLESLWLPQPHSLFICCPGRDWTCDPLIKSQVLSRSATRQYFVIPVGLEPTTPALKVRCSKPTELRNQIPHFTRLTDWLPYGSGGLLLFQDSVEPTGYDPVPLDFQSRAMTTSATAPYFVGCVRSFEIPTSGFTNQHSASELHTPYM